MYKSRNKAEWNKIFEEWESSNMTMDAFCKERSIPTSTFYTAKLRRKNLKPKNTKQKSSQSFVEITNQVESTKPKKIKAAPEPKESKTPSLRMTSPTGMILEVFL